MNRREFLKWAGLSGAAAVTAPHWLKPAKAVPKGLNPSYEAGRWIPTCCHMCGGTTGILTQVVDGRVVRIKPNDDNPVGFSNISDDFFKNAKKEGAVMCPKGNAGIMALYDPERLRKPLLRTNPNKGIGVDPRFKEISWEEAYQTIVSKFKSLRDNEEAHKLLWFSEDHCFTHIQGDFCALFGTPNYSMHSNLCDTSRKAGFKMLLGDERPLIDAIHSKYIFLWGWNCLSATKWAHLPRIITRALENGAKLVVVDPHYSYTAAKATEWVPIRPGTDAALALAMAHVIIRDRLYDQKFIAEWTAGFEKFQDYVKDKTPSWAENITTVPQKNIERLAAEFATTKPAAVDIWSGTLYSNGVYAVWAVGVLAALVGQIDKPGTLMLPEKKGNKHQHIDAQKPPAPRFDGGSEKWLYFHKSGVYVEMINRLVDGKGPYMPKMALIMFQNMMLSMPGTKNVEEALKKLEFIVCVDTMMSETAQMADIVIPGTTYLERYDLNTHWVTWPVVGLRQPVVKPLFGQPAEYEFVIELGRRLGLKESSGNDFFYNGVMSGQKIQNLTEWYEEYLSKELKDGEPGITLAELKELPGATWVSQEGTRYEKFKQKGFNTPSKKVQFYAKEHEHKTDAYGKEVYALPVYFPRDWQPDGTYPLFLINWKEASQTHSRTQNNRYLAEIKQTDTLRIHTKTAQKLGIKNGDRVWIESPHGRIQGIAELTEGIHPEVCGTQHGFGHWALGRVAKGRGFHTGFLLPTKADGLAGQALHKEICVRVTKA